MNLKQKVLKPIIPERIYFKQESRVRQEGFTPNNGILIGSLSREEAEEYAELMKITFIEKWKQNQK